MDRLSEFKRSAGRKAPAVPGVVWGQRSRLGLRRAKVGGAGIEKKSPRGVMAWEAFMTGPWGLAGLNVEKDQHERLWQTLTSERVADDEHRCIVGVGSP